MIKVTPNFGGERERLRQIWNQLVLSMGWSEVPLTFPDWRDYLELSNEQGQTFDRIHGEFRDEIEQLVKKRQTDQKAAVQAYQKSVAETLNEEQKEKLQQVFGIQLEPRPIER